MSTNSKCHHCPQITNENPFRRHCAFAAETRCAQRSQQGFMFTLVALMALRVFGIHHNRCVVCRRPFLPLIVVAPVHQPDRLRKRDRPPLMPFRAHAERIRRRLRRLKRRPVLMPIEYALARAAICDLLFDVDEPDVQLVETHFLYDILEHRTIRFITKPVVVTLDKDNPPVQSIAQVLKSPTYSTRLSGPTILFQSAT